VWLSLLPVIRSQSHTSQRSSTDVTWCSMKLFGICELSARSRLSFCFPVETTFNYVKFYLKMKWAKESERSFRKFKYCLCTRNKNQHALMLFNGNRFRHTASSRSCIREEEFEKNKGAILKFVNISSDATSPNEMHEVSSASTSKSLSEVGEETTPGQIRNNGEADVESNTSKAYITEVGNDAITILPNDVSCS